MSTAVHDHSEQSLTSLVGGIVTDFQTLLTHQIQLDCARRSLLISVTRRLLRVS